MNNADPKVFRFDLSYSGNLRKTNKTQFKTANVKKVYRNTTIFIEFLIHVAFVLKPAFEL